MKLPSASVLALLLLAPAACTTDDAAPLDDSPSSTLSYPLPATGQTRCFDTRGAVIGCDSTELPGQDAFHARRPESYTDNGDGTVRDDVTGLVWQQTHSERMAYGDAATYCESLSLGGATDWRVPSIKELYSLIDFDGATGSMPPDASSVPDDAVPYLDTDVFDFQYGNLTGGRFIDAQEVSSTQYVSRTFADNHGVSGGSPTFFGVNFADGRIKGYPQEASHTWFVRCVRGAAYGINDLVDNADGTISDAATGLMWMQDDSGASGAGDAGDGSMDWPSALGWCASSTFGGHDDWRLPNAKELQSLVDYTRSPDTTGTAAIDPRFHTTAIQDEAGDTDYPWYWTSTTHLDGRVPGTDAVYLAFGEALGFTAAPGTAASAFLDVHGAGAQRGDPKTGTRDAFPQWGNGPQGDVRRVFNYVRCVRTEQAGG